jgi:hypothetical protein
VRQVLTGLLTLLRAAAWQEIDLLFTTINAIASRMPACTRIEKVSEPPPSLRHMRVKAFCGLAGSM